MPTRSMIISLTQNLALAVVFILSFATASFASEPSAPRPGVRYTNGTYCIKGWEHQLVGGNANLAHWNWSPMIGYTQSTPSLATGKQAIEAPLPVRRSHYVKPIHVDLPYVAVPNTRVIPALTAKPKKLIESQPQGSTPVLSYGMYSTCSDNVTTRGTVHAMLAHKDGNAQLIHSARRGG